MKLPPGIKVLLPRELASDEVRVQIVARGSAEVKELLACLNAKASELARVADLLAGLERAPASQ
jgi:hypothetical protein